MMKILIQRLASFGDCLSTTPIIQRFRETYPSAEIEIATYHTGAYGNNPHMTRFAQAETKYDKIVILDMISEVNRKFHPVDAHMMKAFGDYGEGHNKDITFAFEKMHNGIMMNNDWAHTVVIHPAKTWPNRMMPLDWWAKVVEALTVKKLKVISIGMGQDLLVPGAIDTRAVFGPAQQAAIIDAAPVFIGTNSGLVQLAGATKTPTITTLTMASILVTFPYRDGIIGKDFYGISADVPCFGCSERAGPVTDVMCDYTDERRYHCIGTLDPMDVVRQALELVESRKDG